MSTHIHEDSVNPRKWLTLFAMTGSLCMILLDTTVVGVALPAIQSDLIITPLQLQWVINAYVLVLASFVAIGGRAADAFGRVPVFITGVILFALSSAWCGFASTGAELVAARVLQGLGAAVMQPASASLVVNSFTPGERGKAMAVYSGIPLLFLAAGPVIGGAITQYANWRWNFWLNIPIALASIALTIIARPVDVRARKRGNDFVGAILLLSSLPLFVWGLMQGSELGWSHPTIASALLAGLILLPTFVWWEKKHTSPLLAVNLFADPAIAIDASILFATQFAMTGLVIYGSIYTQNVLLFDPMKAGASLLPLLAPIIIVIHFAGRLYDRVGVRKPALIGTFLCVIGMAMQATAASLANYPLLATGMLVLGTGIGFVMSPVNTDSMSRVAPTQRGQVSGLVQTLRQIGGSLGVAVVGSAILLSHDSAIEQRIEQTLPQEQRASARELLQQASKGNQEAIVELAANAPLQTIVREVLASSVATGWWICTATLAGAFIAATRLRSMKYPSKPHGAHKPSV
ncbi:MAG: DHA2 family efflux MFS transporter permease subunit [Phycisphaerales bacterium]|nr:DHA2 family efflux MFS transporter permease subunit [Phycisphaerales bacterium]